MEEENGIRHRTVTTNGINVHVAEKGDGPLVLLLHGFPETWYAWRHQITALAELGYRAVDPDLRGFGNTEASASPTQYTSLHMVGDLVGLLDVLAGEAGEEEEKEVYVMGAAIAAWTK